ncbi:MAG: putative ABC transport system permease protein [Bradymonadia bacterium]|jgi:putative ABC transport system permease protein
MTFGRLVSLVARNVSRSKKNFLMSAIGIIVGISTFVFFIGLSEGIKDVVLGQIFLVDQVEVIQKKFDTGFMQMGGGRTLNAASAAELGKIEGVNAVYPKMKFTFPTRGYGGKKLFGKMIHAEIIADGIEPALVEGELKDPSKFGDLRIDRACDAGNKCPDGMLCTDAKCQRQTCDYNKDTWLSDCPGKSYCAPDTRLCEMPIPAVVSYHLLELYNGSLATALSSARNKMPRLSKGMVEGFQLNLDLGKSFLGRAKKGKRLVRRVELVGFSDKAISVGITLPLAYVRDLNRHFAGPEAAATYHSIILKVQDQTQVPSIVAAVKEAGFELADSTENAERAADIIKTVQSVFALVSGIIVGIAAINISQMFFMLIARRRREIGVLRAVGASRNNVRLMILGEAAFIGFIGGLLGIAAGIGAASLADYVANQLPDFPYKPETFFAFPTWLWLAALGGSVFFCLFGAFFPANAAARQDPAAALTH